MRPQILFVATLFALACGTTSTGGGSAGPTAYAGLPPAADAGSGGGAVDAGVGGGAADAGTSGGG